MTAVAVGIQVYAITGSSLAVGLVGLFQLVPLVVFGLYGGALDPGRAASGGYRVTARLPYGEVRA